MKRTYVGRDKLSGYRIGVDLAKTPDKTGVVFVDNNGEVVSRLSGFDWHRLRYRIDDVINEHFDNFNHSGRTSTASSSIIKG